MFDLEKCISDWKRSFQQSCSICEESIEELESHLRESIDDLRRKGLNEEEGFIIATKRLGHAAKLEREYKKNGLVGANQDRLIWMLSGYLGITLCGIFATAIVSSLWAVMAYAGFGATITGVVATAFQLFFWVALAAIVYRIKEAPFVFGKFPVMSLLAMFVAMVTLPFVSPLVTSMQARIVEPKLMIETYYWVGFGSFAIQLLIYAFCFVALYKILRSRHVVAAQ
jgi:hypothetical protein